MNDQRVDWISRYAGHRLSVKPETIFDTVMPMDLGFNILTTKPYRYIYCHCQNNSNYKPCNAEHTYRHRTVHEWQTEITIMGK